MQLDLECAELRLSRHALLKLADGAGVRIVCRAGSVWVTRDHDRRDVVLNPGEVYAEARPGRVIVSALEHARIAITRSDAALPCESRAVEIGLAAAA